MCNCVHESGTRPIKKEGFGYKIFGPKRTTCFCSSHPYTLTEQRVIWADDQKPLYHQKTIEKGFCFFLQKRTAQRCLKAIRIEDTQNGVCDSWADALFVEKIRYFKGLVRQSESAIVAKHFEIALCKEFEFIGQ